MMRCRGRRPSSVLAVPRSGSDSFAQPVMGFPWRVHSTETELKVLKGRIADDVAESDLEVDCWVGTILMISMFILAPPIGR